MVPGWLAKSERFRAAHAGARIDLAYGPGERDRFDLFPAPEPTGAFVIYIHGGYWQRGDKSVYSIVAGPLLAAGIDVAFVNYNLCPRCACRKSSPGSGAASPISGARRRRWAAAVSASASWATRRAATSPPR